MIARGAPAWDSGWERFLLGGSDRDPREVSVKAILRWASSIVIAVLVLDLGEYLRRGGDCADCFAHYGFPFFYRSYGGFAGGPTLQWVGLTADIVAVFLLAWAISEVLRRLAGL